ncbi:hypothetical protein C0992_004523 [Termitomyces sp. T32_za158]|nr:hypothetical protein C0992_004523 [Termitomyces sp. T32_za158]
MIANNGNTEGLFRAGFMQSGSPIPVAGLENGQKYYDALVAQTGCTGASDTLQCLREVPYDKLKAAQDASPGIFAYQSLSLAWLPREDGVFLTENPQQLVLDGKVANVPFITGLSVSQDVIQQIETLYPQDITQGSPFDTGILNAITPQFKRIAAFMGDGVFQAPRRFFLQHRASKQPTWAFCQYRLVLFREFNQNFGLSEQTFQSSADLGIGGGMADYLIRFAVNLNPNSASELQWPQYNLDKPQLLTFLDGLIPVTITSDTYRSNAMNALTNLTLAHPL